MLVSNVQESHIACIFCGESLAFQDFNGLLFCLPMSDEFRKRVEVIIQRSGIATLSAEWVHAAAVHVVQKRVPYVCAIYVYVAAIKNAD